LWWLFAYLILPPVSAEVTIRDVLQLRAVNRTSVRIQLAAELRIVIRAALVEGSHIAVATTALAVGLGVMGVEVVAARESTMAARYPAYMGLLLGVALHVTLEVLLALETALAAGLLALELNLLNDVGQVLQAHVRSQELLFRWLASWLTVCADHLAISVDWRNWEVLVVFIVARHATVGSVTAWRSQRH
jgi:hypothetical protein